MTIPQDARALFRYRSTEGEGPLPGAERTDTLALPRAYTLDNAGVPRGWQECGLRHWQRTPECIDGYVLPNTDAGATIPLFSHNHGGYLRYTTSATLPAGWTTQTQLAAPLGYIFDAEREGTTPLYQLSWWSDALGTWLQFLTSSPYEYEQAKSLGWRPGVPADAELTKVDAVLMNASLGEVYASSLHAIIVESPDVYPDGSRKAVIAEHAGKPAALGAGESIELTIDPALPEMRMTSIELFDTEPPPGETGTPVASYVLEDGKAMNTTDLTDSTGSAAWALRIWQCGNRAIRMVQQATTGANLWYRVRLEDERGGEWVFDPEILDQTGNQQGPSWGSTAQA